MQKPLVENAANTDQIQGARLREKDVRARDLEDLKVVLSTISGRRFVWKLLGFCKVNGSVWESSARIHYNSGQQDVGHHILSEIIAADEDAYLSMMKESKGGKYV